MDSNNNDEFINYENSSNPRPWIRYWARSIDMNIFLAFLVLLKLIFFPNRQLDITIASLGLYLLWIPLEAQLLSTWGTTPGKWLLNVKVRDSKLNKLTLKTALLRSLYVWTIGLGMGLFSSITIVISYFTLKNTKITIWDKSFNCNILHEEVPKERLIIIIAVIIFLPLFVVSFI
ncbi:RDD family protein [Acetivibrio cellulolyticus]|uniref:RDD family protein n=1 Tax=Acetivibrio cellulolyticus TaxID=35830 RepID=UPI0001E2C30F|nr:RDD family protein [Acetivibrio cellulolyticus]